MIEQIRTYIETCPFLNELAELNQNNSIEQDKNYSINESADYNPVIYSFLNGEKEMQFAFHLDTCLSWTDPLQENTNTSLFFEKFRNWLEENDEQNIYPEVDANILPLSISTTTNEYMVEPNSTEALYRINGIFTYIKTKGEENNE